MDIFSQFDINTTQWLWVIACGVFVGMSKAGISGLGMFVVPVLASVFGAKESTGIVLPMLIMADIMAVIYYNRHANMKLLVKVAPATITGVFLAIWIGDLINDQQFKALLAVIVILGVIIMIWHELKKSNEAIPHNWTFASMAGLLGGFTTMIGNAAGPVMSIYFLAMRLKKNNFIGTAAWFFLLVNVFKVPFHITIWHTITLNTFLFNLATLPLIVIGMVAGIKIVKYIPEKPYRIFIISTVTLAALKLFF
ncbi:MAG: sulfite exporter TauE/SafE family protein [Cyclobacteriaceae bacterium]